MDFGAGRFKLEASQYPFEKAAVFSNAKKKLLVGLPQWGTKAWIGKLYSKDCKQKDFLEEYAERLSCVEVSSTFYAPVADETLLSWKDSVPEGFRFLPKWPQIVTHQKFLRNAEADIKDFCRKIELLEDNLGATILQLPPSFSRESGRELHQFLLKVPRDFPLTIELRHPSWFQDFRLIPKLEEFLVKNKIGMAVSDTPGARDVFHLSFTGGHHVIRYLSDSDSTHDEWRLKRWREWIDQTNLSCELSFCLHRPDNDSACDLISFFAPEYREKIDLLNQDKQTSLF